MAVQVSYPGVYIEEFAPGAPIQSAATNIAAILGPLADKRFSTINRIETAIGRNAAKPNLNAEGLKTCSLNE